MYSTSVPTQFVQNAASLNKLVPRVSFAPPSQNIANRTQTTTKTQGISLKVSTGLGEVECNRVEQDSRRKLLAGFGLMWLYSETSPAKAEESEPEIVEVVEIVEESEPTPIETPASTGPKKVFVAGATGQTGRRVVEQLKQRGVAVRAGVRDMKKAKSIGLPGPNVELVQFDVTGSLDSIKAAIGDADCVVCATGFSPSAANWGGLKPGSSNAVDQKGTEALVQASTSLGSVSHFVLVSSLLTNGIACGQKDNPNFSFLEAFGGILSSKRAAEVALQESGLAYTVVRPGGLSNEAASAFGGGAIVSSGADTLFGLDTDPGREISRDSVAEVCIEALYNSEADNKIVEIVGAKSSGRSTPKASWFDVPVAPSAGCAV